MKKLLLTTVLVAIGATSTMAAIPQNKSLMCETKEAIYVVKDLVNDVAITEVTNIGEKFQQSTEKFKKSGITFVDEELIVIAKTKNKITDLLFRFIENGKEAAVNLKIDFDNNKITQDGITTNCNN